VNTVSGILFLLFIALERSKLCFRSLSSAHRLHDLTAVILNGTAGRTYVVAKCTPFVLQMWLQAYRKLLHQWVCTLNSTRKVHVRSIRECHKSMHRYYCKKTFNFLSNAPSALLSCVDSINFYAYHAYCTNDLDHPRKSCSVHIKYIKCRINIYSKLSMSYICVYLWKNLWHSIN